MSNKYLEKIALNKIETYLSSQPQGREFSRKSIQKAYTNIQFANANKRISKALEEMGATEQGINEHFAKHIEGIRRNRSRKYNGPLANNGYKFDELAKNANPQYRAEKLVKFKAQKQTVKNKPKLLTKIKNIVKKHPVATGVTLAVGAGLAYGTKKNNDK